MRREPQWLSESAFVSFLPPFDLGRRPGMDWIFVKWHFIAIGAALLASIPTAALVWRVVMRITEDDDELD